MGQELGDVQALQLTMASKIGEGLLALETLQSSTDSLQEHMASSLALEASKDTESS